MLIAGLGLFLYAFLKRRSLGLPKGQTIYFDTNHLSPNSRNLYDPEIGLTGRPDYLVKSGNKIIPVELKSSKGPSKPYDTHIIQLGAYCLLVDQLYGIRPEYGILHYPEGTFKIPYTSELEKRVLKAITTINSQENRSSLDRSHKVKERCRHCGYRENCDQKLL